MTDMDKKLYKYVTDLLKYSENSGVFNPNFYTHEIPEIFCGWSEIDFNMVHHGAGEGCCTIIGAGRYKINIAHCNKILREFKPEGNIATGNVITATNSTVVVGDSNIVANRTENKPNKSWHETAAFKIIVPILIGLLVAFLGYYFRWK